MVASPASPTAAIEAKMKETTRVGTSRFLAVPDFLIFLFRFLFSSKYFRRNIRENLKKNLSFEHFQPSRRISQPMENTTGNDFLLHMHPLSLSLMRLIKNTNYFTWTPDRTGGYPY